MTQHSNKNAPGICQFYQDRLHGSWPFWSHVLSGWNRRELPNVLLVHYADLKADTACQIRNIARFLEIDVADDQLPTLLKHIDFQFMKRNAHLFDSPATSALAGGAKTLLREGVNGRWQECLTADEAARFDRVAASMLPDGCAQWLQNGLLPR